MKRDPTHPHLTVDDISLLLEGRLGEINRATIVAHLRTCADCFRIYQDSALEKGLVETGASVAEGDKEDLVALGMQVSAQLRAGGGVERPTGWRIPNPFGVSAVGGRSRALAYRVAVGIAALVIVASAGWMAMRVMQRPNYAVVEPGTLQPVQLAVGEFSKMGDLVLPGGEGYLDGPVTVYRSGSVATDDSFESSLRDLFAAFRDGDASPDAAYWLIAGNVATGRIGAARIYVSAARERFPHDPRFVVLDAVVAWQDRQLDRSETLLRDVLSSRLDDQLAAVARINLAVVLRDRGKVAEAREILSGVQKRFAGTPIGERAEGLSTGLGG